MQQPKDNSSILSQLREKVYIKVYCIHHSCSLRVRWLIRKCQIPCNSLLTSVLRRTYYLLSYEHINFNTFNSCHNQRLMHSKAANWLYSIMSLNRLSLFSILNSVSDGKVWQAEHDAMVLLYANDKRRLKFHRVPTVVPYFIFNAWKVLVGSSNPSTSLPCL